MLDTYHTKFVKDWKDNLVIYYDLRMSSYQGGPLKCPKRKGKNIDQNITHPKKKKK